jgi:glycine C-acetyltransferase
MPLQGLSRILAGELEELRAKGTAKGEEPVVVEVLAAAGGHGPRVRLAGEGERPFLLMNSNGYLGMARRPEVVAAEEEAARAFGCGPGAVRFISGTYGVHLELERRLAAFHGREAAMLFSSAYMTMLGVFPALVSAETAIVSDELNHNCIINAIRLARPKEKYVYRHNRAAELDAKLEEAAAAGCRRALVVTDGIFSMRGDHAPLQEISEICRRHEARFAESVVLIVDDSHGVGAFGETGRGVEEHTGAPPVDVLIGTLGKALGVNGGYVASTRLLCDYLRQKAATYIYSNPITPAEAAAALRALEILDGPQGRELLEHLRAMTRRFADGLVRLGFETISGGHPVVPLLVRDTPRTAALVANLRRHGVLATGLNFPVVPKGDESIRFQVSAEHTPADIDYVLEVLRGFAATARP